jgi:hypothetical protein
MSNPLVTLKFDNIDHELLKQSIVHHVNMAAPKLTPNIKMLMAISLTQFILDATSKFAAGQLEHGGDIRDRDLQAEIYKEQLDTFWYNKAQSWPTHIR